MLIKAIFMGPDQRTMAWPAKSPGGRSAEGQADRVTDHSHVQRASSYCTVCARPAWLMNLHGSRLACGMHGCEHGFVEVDCCSPCDPLMRALVVCNQDSTTAISCFAMPMGQTNIFAIR